MSDYPFGMRLSVDHQTRELPDGSLLGGSPRRMLRLSGAGWSAYSELKRGPVLTPAQARLARKLTDAGVLHPLAEPNRRIEATVLIPIRDRAEALDHCLRALSSTYPVLVVDDGSAQPELVAKVCADHGATYLARPTNGGPAAARNSGVNAVETEFVLLLDSDCVPPADIIDALAGHFCDPLVAAVAPRVIGDNGYLSPLDLGPNPASVAPGRPVSYVPTAALLVRRQALPRFDEALRWGEDVDVIWKLVEAGHRVRYEPSVVVSHAEPKALGHRLRRRFHYGTSAGPLARRHPGALPPLVIHPFSMLVLAGVLLRRPVLATVGIVGGYRELRNLPSATQRRTLVVRSAWMSWLALSRVSAQFALPVILLAPRRRARLTLLLVSAPLAIWSQRRAGSPIGPIRFTADHVAGGAAYGLGVLVGCARTGSLEPLQPVLTRSLRRAPKWRTSMPNAWFETVAIAQVRAKKRLPKSVYSALIAGSERGQTIEENVAAFTELGFAPHVAGLSPTRDLTTTVMGQTISMPVLISPTGVQAVHPDGEVAVARAAAARDIAMGLSSFASKPVEEVVAANPKTFFQMYWVGTREDMLVRMERARAAGAVGIIVTLDWSFSHGRDWGSPSIPDKVGIKTAFQFAPEVMRHPRWLAKFLRAGLPDLSVPNMVVRGEQGPTFFGAYGQWMGTPPPTWEELAWLRKQWDAPFMLKGVMRVDDALRAVDAGVSAISVSNHGGNNLDGTPAPIRALPAIAEAVGDQIDVLLDGGVRRGSDVVKAVALGARAVMIGRAYLWGLGANGQAGVENVLDIMRSGIDSALLGLGRSSIAELNRADLIVPDGFERRLGLPA